MLQHLGPTSRCRQIEYGQGLARDRRLRRRRAPREEVVVHLGDRPRAVTSGPVDAERVGLGEVVLHEEEIDANVDARVRRRRPRHDERFDLPGVEGRDLRDPLLLVLGGDAAVDEDLAADAAHPHAVRAVEQLFDLALNAVHRALVDVDVNGFLRAVGSNE